MVAFTHRVELPDWARWNERDGYVEVDPGAVYPLFLMALGVGAPDQYWLEVARKCFTRKLAEIVRVPFALRITHDAAWRLDRFAEGEGAARGAAEAIAKHYAGLKL